MTKKKFRIISLILLIIVSLLALATVVTAVLLGIRGAREGILGHKKQSENDLTPLSPLGESADFGEFYIRSTVFLGDSVILGMRDSGVLAKGKETDQIWCGEGGDLALDYNIDKAAVIDPESGRAIAISEMAEEMKPSRIIITVGINNGVPYCSEESFKAYYKKLVKTIQSASPDTDVILQSVFPTSKKYQKDNSAITVEKIDLANRWISEIAAECRVGYLHTCSVLKDSDGYLLSKYDSGDGLRLNAEGYRAVLHYIRTHGYK